VSHPNIAHWDDVEEHDHEEGSIHSAWRYLGEAVGTVAVGVNRIRIHPGYRSTPLHSHGDHEEIFFVLGGSGLSWQRSEGGENVVCEVGPGTCLVHPATGPAHTLVAGPHGLDVLAYGNARRSGAAGYDWFPRIDKVGIGPSLFDVDLAHQWALEGALPEPELPEPGERPRNVVRVEDVEPELLDRGEFGDWSRELGAAAGSVETGLNHSDMPSGKLNCPLHCHASEEEGLFPRRRPDDASSRARLLGRRIARDGVHELADPGDLDRDSVAGLERVVIRRYKACSGE
jgi:uncharacterized cupin superfamily protein